MSLLDQASLIVTPNAYKESKLYSIVPSDGSGDLAVTRATTATRVNSSGLIEVVPRNLLTYSNTFTNAAWTKTNATVTANATISPDGTNNAYLLSCNTNVVGTNYIRQYKNIVDNKHTLTFYAKANSSNIIKIAEAAYTGQELDFNLSNNTISGSGSQVSGSIESIDNGWKRIIFTYTYTSGQTDCYLNINSTSAYIYGAQLEQGSTATEYFPTTTRLNIPRIDYSNGSCPSLLVEPQRTNLQAYSNDFNLWNVVNTTVTANNGISPDGTQNADRVQFSTGGLIYYGSNGSSGQNTLSVYAKAKNGVSAKFRFFANGNTLLSTDQTANGTWQKFTFTYTYSALTAGLAIATTGADDILFYGFQHEIGTYPTSYIPTTSSAVTRNADVISKTGISSLIGQTEGTLFADINYDSNIGGTKIITGLALNGSSFIYSFISGTTLVLSVYNSGILQCYLTYALPSSGKYKIAVAYKLNDFIIYVNGANVASQTSGTIPTCSIIYVGNDFLTVLNKLNYNSVQLYKTRLTNSELQSLTTL